MFVLERYENTVETVDKNWVIALLLRETTKGEGTVLCCCVASKLKVLCIVSYRNLRSFTVEISDNSITGGYDVDQYRGDFTIPATPKSHPIQVTLCSYPTYPLGERKESGVIA